MVSKCANPACSVPLHYLRDGKVVRIEVENASPGDGSSAHMIPFVIGKKPSRRVEHFWLCGKCCLTMNLLWDQEQGVVVVPKAAAPIARRAAAS